MKKMIIVLGIITIIVGLTVISVRIIIGDNDNAHNVTNYIVVKEPVIKEDVLGKTEYPEMDYKYLDDTDLEFFVDGTVFLERTGEFDFFVDEECKKPIKIDPVFISSQIVKCGKSYAVLAEGSRVLYFPVGDEIPHLIRF